MNTSYEQLIGSLPEDSPALPNELYMQIQQTIIDALYFKTGRDFRGYRSGAIERRLEHLQSLYKLTCISEMLPLILNNQNFAEEVSRKLLLHVTNLFRDPEFWLSFRNNVLPFLDSYYSPRIWLAGCASGEEVYSLAILLTEHELLKRSKLYATDLSSDILAMAKKREFSVESIRESTDSYFRAGGLNSFADYYTVVGEKFVLPQFLIENCLFSVHDLVQDQVFTQTQVIICRNVLIYFDRTLRDRVLQLFVESLIPGGFLCLGNCENIQFSDVEQHFSVVDQKNKIFQRI